MSNPTNKFSSEVRGRAVRMASKHRADHSSEWDAMVSIAGKIGCTAETLRRRCRDEAVRCAGPAALAGDERARRDGGLKEHILRVHEASFDLCESRKVWRLLRETVSPSPSARLSV